MTIAAWGRSQAAAEYVGILFRDATAAISSIGNQLVAFARANPVALLVGVVVLAALWSTLARR